jgi:hypothetical protein
MPRLLAPLSVPEPSIGDPPASIRFNRLGVGIVLLGLLVILAFSGSSAYDAWRSYGYSVDAAEREIGYRPLVSK